MQERRFDAGQVVLNYAEGPDNGPPLVVVHGGSYRWQTERGYIERLMSRWHIFAVDLRGHGASGRAPGHYGVLDYAADVGKLIQEKVGGRCAYMGWSLGALTGIGVASTQPASVYALVLRDPVWSRLFDQGFRDAMREMHRDFARIEANDAAVAELLSRRPDLSRDGANERLTARSQADPAFLVPLYEGTLLDGLDCAAALRSITAPTLVVQADDKAGGGLPDEDARRIKAEMRDVEVVRFLGYGHDLDLHRPSGPFDVIAGFLNRAPRPND